MIEFEVGGINYHAGKIDARTQFHVVRRIAPLMASFSAVSSALPALQGGDGAPAGDEAMFASLKPFLEAMGEMKDVDADYVLNACLGVVSREAGPGVWAPVMVRGTGTLAYADIELPAMMQIAWKVLQQSLSGFFPAKPAQ